MPSHRLVHPEVVKRLAAAPVPPVWPSYSGLSRYVGTTNDGRCTVYYDPSLGNAGLQNATDLLADAPRVMDANDAIFGFAGKHVDVIIFALGGMTDGTGGADHADCTYSGGSQIEVCASFGNSMRISGLLAAEISECSMSGGA